MPTRIYSWRDFGLSGFLVLGATCLYMLTFLAWFASMGMFLGSIVKPELRIPPQFFVFALTYPVIYFPIVLTLISPAICFQCRFFCCFTSYA
jgi:hypothetical protein